MGQNYIVKGPFIPFVFSAGWVGAIIPEPDTLASLVYRWEGEALDFSVQFCFKKGGRARTQAPTTRNCTVELLHL